MDKIRIQRANVILDISPEEKERYMSMGYSVIDAVSGKVLEEAVPNDIISLRCSYHKMKKEIEEKDKEIESLKKKLAKEIKANKQKPERV